jgi:hypothetical protein
MGATKRKPHGACQGGAAANRGDQFSRFAKTTMNRRRGFDNGSELRNRIVFWSVSDPALKEPFNENENVARLVPDLIRFIRCTHILLSHIIWRICTNTLSTIQISPIPALNSAHNGAYSVGSKVIV